MAPGSRSLAGEPSWVERVELPLSYGSRDEYFNCNLCAGLGIGSRSINNKLAARPRSDLALGVRNHPRADGIDPSESSSKKRVILPVNWSVVHCSIGHSSCLPYRSTLPSCSQSDDATVISIPSARAHARCGQDGEVGENPRSRRQAGSSL